jgi:hypothetical protein
MKCHGQASDDAARLTERTADLVLGVCRYDSDRYVRLRGEIDDGAEVSLNKMKGLGNKGVEKVQ